MPSLTLGGNKTYICLAFMKHDNLFQLRVRQPLSTKDNFMIYAERAFRADRNGQVKWMESSKNVNKVFINNNCIPEDTLLCKRSKSLSKLFDLFRCIRSNFYTTWVAITGEMWHKRSTCSSNELFNDSNAVSGTSFNDFIIWKFISWASSNLVKAQSFKSPFRNI